MLYSITMLLLGIVLSINYRKYSILYSHGAGLFSYYLLHKLEKLSEAPNYILQVKYFL